jgi:hypothetical protein
MVKTMGSTVAVSFFLSVVLCGCTIHRPYVPMQPIQIGQKEDPIALSYGEASAEYFFFFGPFGDDSTAAAIKNAVDRYGADALINMVVERKTFFLYPLYFKKTTTVLGTAIKYKDAPNFKRPQKPETRADDGVREEKHSPITTITQPNNQQTQVEEKTETIPARTSPSAVATPPAVAPPPVPAVKQPPKPAGEKGSVEDILRKESRGFGKRW